MNATSIPRVGGHLGHLAGWWLTRPAWIRWSPVLGIMACLWWLSSRSGGNDGPGIGGELGHNSLHLVAFGSLATAAWFACAAEALDRKVRAGLAAFAIAVGYGVIDELHQSFVPGRTCSVWDVMTDASGAAVVVWVLHSWATRRRPRLLHGVCLIAACAGSVVLATYGP